MTTTVYRPSASSTGDVAITGDISASGTLNTVGITSAANSKVIELSADENVGIGNATLNSWNALFTALQLGGNTSLWTTKAIGASGQLNIGHNVYRDSGGEKYISTDEASQYRQLDGTHVFNLVSLGSAGGAITWATNLKIDRSATARDTRLLIYDVDNASLERVSVGIADSGGAGFKLLRIQN